MITKHPTGEYSVYLDIFPRKELEKLNVSALHDAVLDAYPYAHVIAIDHDSIKVNIDFEHVLEFEKDYMNDTTLYRLQAYIYFYYYKHYLDLTT